jgi:carboxyl-terminal processing protease
VRLSGDLVQGAVARDGVACVSVRAFSADVAARVFALVRRLSCVRALVLDLRGNPGGDLAGMVALASDFLPEGSEIVTVIDGDGDAVVHRARGGALYDVPVAIVVDGRTASAAEMFAGCLRAHGRARIFGEATWGKASAQAFVGARYETVARCALPGGEIIEGAGIRPDVEASGDLALEAAIAALTSSSPA